MAVFVAKEILEILWIKSLCNSLCLCLYPGIHVSILLIVRGG